MSVDLSTQWLGLKLDNPIVASSGPLTGNIDSLRRLEDAGLSAVVLPSIFEEQVKYEEAELQRARSGGSESSDEADEEYPPDVPDLRRRSDEQLALVRAAKSALSIPVIGSLNGTTTGGWVDQARKLEEAGADAIELNLYSVPADIRRSGAEIEARTVELTRHIHRATKLPFAVKISPFYSSPGHMAVQLVEAGAGGVVLFNRFLQPDIDLEELTVEPRVALSSSEEARLALRWIALLRGHVTAGLAASSGVHQATEVLKLLLAGADVTMMTSALLLYGPSHVERVLVEVREWLDAHELSSVEQMKGSLSQANSPNPEVFERAQYMAALTTHVWRAGW